MLRRAERGRRFAAVALLGAAAALAACASEDSAASARARPSPVLDARGEPVGLEHHRRWSDRIGQGGQPEGEDAFRNLAALGYRTVLSVDGAPTDVAAAARHGLVYAHVPVEYSGISREQALAIVKTVRDAGGPVYVHCHHGIHRGPAGAALARIALDGVTPQQAVADLRASGCSERYAGLYRDVAAFAPPPAADLERVPAAPACARVDGVVEHMAGASRAFERLAGCEMAGWAAPADHPDLDAPHEARILLEHFREMARLEECRAYGEDFVRRLAAAEATTGRVETALVAGDVRAASAALADVRTSCDGCHKLFRDR